MLSGAFGVGGAVISTPGIRILGASAFQAVGTTLPAIIPSAAVGTARYAREQLVDWPVVGATAPVGVATAVGASYASHAVPGEGHLLMVLTAAILGYTAWRMARRD
ncbi:MAG TPA: sulfite exporter TauE/SafE family protein, partial [Acidimicrobiales bacterium]|nr:sulfite exporter TauE/SafE family protein [Acidimicrobiales bacterium]